MDPRIRQLYKRLIFLGRDYPRGLTDARNKLQSAFKRPLAENTSLEQALGRGEYVARELEALVFLAKYRALFKRYGEGDARTPLTVDSGGAAAHQGARGFTGPSARSSGAPASSGPRSGKPQPSSG